MYKTILFMKDGCTRVFTFDSYPSTTTLRSVIDDFCDVMSFGVYC